MTRMLLQSTFIYNIVLSSHTRGFFAMSLKQHLPHNKIQPVSLSFYILLKLKLAHLTLTEVAFILHQHFSPPISFKKLVKHARHS